MPANTLTPQSHEWWIARMWRKLDERTARIQLYDDYYEGNQRLRFTTIKARDTFGDAFRGFADNFCVLVVDAIEERLRVRGFRVTGGTAPARPDGAPTPANDSDPDAMRIWNANDMDSQVSMAHIEALVNEESYLIVWVDGDRTTPVITAESPFEVIVERDMAQRRKRLAAMKRWVDEDDRHWRVVLYLPDEIVKFRSVAEQKDGASASDGIKKVGFWEPWKIDGEEWPLPNPLGIVPVVPLTNGARLGPYQHGTSEIKAAIPLQDAINKTIFDSLIASEFVAYPQRYMVGVTLPKDENDQPVEPFKAGVDRLWLVETAEGSAINPIVGQFAQGDLSSYQARIDGFIGNLAAITKTPQHYLVNPGGGTNLSGETVKALEAPLVSKARRKHSSFGVGHQEVMAIALRLEAGGAWVEGDEDRVEVDWWDPETRTEAQHVDALLKLATLEVPVEQLWADAGYTPEQISRFQAYREATPPPTQPVRVTDAVAPSASIAAATGDGASQPVSPSVAPAAPVQPGA